MNLARPKALMNFFLSEFRGDLPGEDVLFSRAHDCKWCGDKHFVLHTWLNLIYTI